MHVPLRIAAGGRDGEVRVLESVRSQIRAVDSRLPVLKLQTMRDRLDGSFDLCVVRTGARMFAIFGGVACIVAGAGEGAVRFSTR